MTRARRRETQLLLDWRLSTGLTFPTVHVARVVPAHVGPVSRMRDVLYGRHKWHHGPLTLGQAVVLVAVMRAQYRARDLNPKLRDTLRQLAHTVDGMATPPEAIGWADDQHTATTGPLRHVLDVVGATGGVIVSLPCLVNALTNE